jgi:hypothetical protein
MLREEVGKLYFMDSTSSTLNAPLSPIPIPAAPRPLQGENFRELHFSPGSEPMSSPAPMAMSPLPSDALHLHNIANVRPLWASYAQLAEHQSPSQVTPPTPDQNGRRWFVNSSGHPISWETDGAVQTYIGGAHVTRQEVDGVEQHFFQGGGHLQVQLDGTRSWATRFGEHGVEYPDGQAIRLFANGDSEMRDPDGNIDARRNGQHILERNEGTHILVHPDGAYEVMHRGTHADQQMEHFSRQGKEFVIRGKNPMETHSGLYGLGFHTG